MLRVFNTYAHVIASYRITKFEQFGPFYRLKGEIVFINNTKLHFREAIFDVEKRKYAYHWQDEDEQLIIRWDNAPDWQVETFPHHRHVGDSGSIEPSFERTLEKVLQVISEKILK